MLENVRKLGLVFVGCGLGIYFVQSLAMHQAKGHDSTMIIVLTPHVLMLAGAMLANTYTANEKARLLRRKSAERRLYQQLYGKKLMGLFLFSGWVLVSLGALTWLFLGYTSWKAYKDVGFLAFIIGFILVFCLEDHTRTVSLSLWRELYDKPNPILKKKHGKGGSLPVADYKNEPVSASTPTPD